MSKKPPSGRSGRPQRSTPSRAIGLATASSREEASVELASRELRIVARRVLTTPLVVALSEVAAVVDLRRSGADRMGVVGSEPLRRPPARGTLQTAGTRVAPTVAIVFRSPQSVPGGSARRLGVKAPKGEAAAVDLLELCPSDPDELLTALAGARVAGSASLYDALGTTIGVVDDPDDAAVVSAERERAARRSGRLLLGAVVLPVVVLAVAAALSPADVRGQVLVLLLIWVGVAVVLGTSTRKANARTIERLGPPADPGGTSA